VAGREANKKKKKVGWGRERHHGGPWALMALFRARARSTEVEDLLALTNEELKKRKLMAPLLEDYLVRHTAYSRRRGGRVSRRGSDFEHVVCESRPSAYPPKRCAGLPARRTREQKRRRERSSGRSSPSRARRQAIDARRREPQRALRVWPSMLAFHLDQTCDNQLLELRASRPPSAGIPGEYVRPAAVSGAKDVGRSLEMRSLPRVDQEVDAVDRTKLYRLAEERESHLVAMGREFQTHRSTW